MKNSMAKSGKVLEELAKYIQENNHAFEQFAVIAKEHSDRLSKAMEPLKGLFEGMSRSFQQMPQSVTVLAESGWYISFDFEIVDLNHFASRLQAGDSDYVDNKMIEMLDEMFDRISDGIYHNFPQRRNPIEAALNAHKRGEYFLSIPVFFAQIEGMCKELTGSRFFSVKKGTPKTATWENDVQADTILSALVEPLKHTGVMRSVQIPDKPVGVNRHDVLHGDSNDYGQKVNGYKVLSLLNYVANTIADVKQFPKH